MATDFTTLEEKYGERFAAMADLQGYFNAIATGDYADHKDVEVNLLPPEECVERTQEFCEFHPLFEPLEILILDDADTSNHHCYVPGLPVPGSVIYLSHDGRPTQIAFRSLNDFLHAAHTAISTKRFLPMLHVEGIVLCPDQSVLTESIREAFASYEEYDAEAAIMLMLQSSDLSDLDLMSKIAADDNFYFGETIAKRIAKAPSLPMRELAEICASHKHPQVAKPGKKALDAINALQ
jgi:hypothetical protein